MKTLKEKPKEATNKETVQRLSENLEEQIISFIEHHNATRLSKNLRRMLIQFLMAEGAVEALYLNDLLHDLEGLFDLLDEIEDDTARILRDR